MRLFGVLAFTVALMSAAAARAELINGTQFQSGNWKGAAYTNDSTGRFSHCAMSTAYQSGISMFFAVSDNYTWRIGWSNTSWNLNVNQTYTVSLSVDGVNAGTVQGKAVNRQFFVGELPAQAALFDLFRRGNQLTMVTGNDRFQFSLLGTNAALTVLLNCTRTQLASAPSQPRPPQSGADRPGPITTPQPAQPSPQPTPPPPPANPRRLWPESTAQQRVEAARTLSAILALPTMQGFRPMSEREAIDRDVAQSARADLAWRADLLTGALDIVPAQSGLSASAIAGAIVAADRRACGAGRFDSGTTADPRSQRVARLFTTCEASLRTTEARYMVVPMADGASHYVFAMVGPSFQSGDGRTEVAKAADELRQAVLEVVRQ
jgi:hypothetical protein